MLHNVHGRIRSYCRNKAQGLGCSGKGSYLDVYEQQITSDLAHFALPAEWKQQVQWSARNDDAAAHEQEQQRQHLQNRLAPLKDLYA